MKVRVRFAVKCRNKSHDVAVHLLESYKPGNFLHGTVPSSHDTPGMSFLHILLVSSPDVASNVQAHTSVFEMNACLRQNKRKNLHHIHRKTVCYSSIQI